MSCNSNVTDHKKINYNYLNDNSKYRINISYNSLQKAKNENYSIAIEEVRHNLLIHVCEFNIYFLN